MTVRLKAHHTAPELQDGTYVDKINVIIYITNGDANEQ